MKKTIFFLSLLLMVSAPILAANKGTGAQGVNSQQKTTQNQERLVSPSPTGNMVQNQNQIKTQNQGEESQIQTNTQEQENLGETQETPKASNQGMPKKPAPRSQTALEHMSNVAAKVQEILTTRITKGGIGEQVRQIAQQQKTVQEELKNNLEKVDNRSGWLKTLFGPNYQVLKNMEKLIEQNQLRIQKLTELKNQLTNQAEIAQVEEMIQALINQNTALKERINLEEKTGSLFGWLFRLFAR